MATIPLTEPSAGEAILPPKPSRADPITPAKAPAPPAAQTVDSPPTAPEARAGGKLGPQPTRQPDLAPSPTPRPGATNLLEACWGPQDLRGRPGERKIRNHLTPDHRPPEFQVPQTPLSAFPQIAPRSLRSVTPINREKLIALTFDLCEQADEVTGYDGDLVDTLRAQDVKATFYAGGKWMQSHPERTMQLMADPRFELGNHAWTHGNLRVLQGAEMENQIRWTQAEYERLRDQLLALPCAAPLAASKEPPRSPKTFRFPYGTCNKESLEAVVAAGLYPVQWSIVTGDPAKGQTAARIVKTVMSQLKPGSIVVAHGNGRGWHTAEALKTLIPALRKQGYRFVTVSELLWAGTHVTAAQCYEVREGDNLRYDKLFGKGTQ
ncbi:MAG: polysaccharide deacetylase family protein [Chromatiaceae bacterium]|nr:polysaccharide deacetylase family protein [Chromatiaceae bacterium]